MAATHSEGSYGIAVGVTTPLEHRMAQVSEFVKTTTANLIRPGVLYTGSTSLVSGRANMAYDVAPFSAVATRSATSGAWKFSNDATTTVSTTAAPGSNSRYDVVYAWQREYALDGTNSDPVIGVAQGTAAASPTVPSLAAFPGAIELARILVPAGVTATNSGTTFTQTAPFTSVDGGKVPFRTTTEMNLWTTALTDQRATDLSTGIIYRWNSSAWKAWESDWISYTPVFTNITLGTGGSPGVLGSYQYLGGRVRDRWSFRLGTSGMVVGSAPTKTLPVTMATPGRLFQKLTSEVGYYDDNVPTPYAGVLFAENGSTTTVRLATQAGTGALSSVTSVVPFTWAASDGGAGDWTYDPA